MAFFERLVELYNGTFSLTPREILDSGSGTVVALRALDAERNGQRGTFDTVQVWSFESGKATRLREFDDQQAALDAFWS